MHLILLSMLQACTEKSEETGTETETETTISPASFTYECPTESNCSAESRETALTDEAFSQYLTNGEITEESCASLCWEELNIYESNLCACEYTGTNDAGEHAVTCEEAYCYTYYYEGRVHGNIPKTKKNACDSALGSYFARVSNAEASSIAAFLQLRKELAFHNAPKELLDRCFLAAKQEVDHARVMVQLAENHQGKLAPFIFGKFEPRTLLDLALDNAVEGCIFETFSALKLLQQAQNSNHPVLAQTMQQIALDEVAHAELAWDIHKYLLTKLSTEERSIVRKAQRDAVQKLMNNLDSHQQFTSGEQEFLGITETNQLRKIFAQRWEQLAA